MLGFPLNGGDKSQQFVFGDPDRDDVGDLRPALGQGPGLVHHNRIDARRNFQGGSGLEQNSPLRTEARSDHDGGRRRQPQGIRAGDHDDRDGVEHRARQAGTGEQPRGQRGTAADEGDEHEPERRAVGEALARSLGVLGLLDEAGTICASAVSAPILVARTRKVPVVFTVAPITLEPTVLATGRLSPVTMDSSISDSPSSTIPSVGIFAPGRTMSRSPWATSAVGTFTGSPSRITSAIEGASSSSVRMASFAPPRAHLEPMAQQDEAGQDGWRPHRKRRRHQSG